jgi:hypothetical protein
METIRGIIHAGKVEFVEPVEIPEGTEVLVTLPDDGDKQFWLKASERSLDVIWDNSEDDVYEQLLQK